jgi:threonine synthase
MWEKSKDLFLSYSVDDIHTVHAMKDVYKKYNYLIDPHTAVASKAVETLQEKLVGKTIILSTAHPAKFPLVVKNAGLEVKEVPISLSEIFNKQEKIYNFPASKKQIFDFITKNNS